MSLPSSTISRSSASFSAREPSTQWMRSGRVSAAIPTPTRSARSSRPPAPRADRRTSVTTAAWRVHESGVRVKIRQEPWGVAPHRSTLRSVFFLYFLPSGTRLPSGLAVKSCDSFAILKECPLHRWSCPRSAIASAISASRTGSPSTNSASRSASPGQPAEPHRERQTRAQLLCCRRSRPRPASRSPTCCRRPPNRHAALEVGSSARSAARCSASSASRPSRSPRA